MKKLMMIAACAALFAGCSVTKVDYEKNDKGEVSYRLYRNSHWLKTEGEGIRGGMTQDGKFEFDLAGMKSSPSEEFNRTMQTYTTAFVQLAQIAAAAYNPSSSAAVSKAVTTPATSTATDTASAANAEKKQTQTQAAVNTGAQQCSDGKCSDATSTAASDCTGCKL